MRAICVIPVFNNASTIARIVGECREQGLAVVVVNDGSTDDSAGVSRKAGATVVSFVKNRGKGAALRSGFSYILREHPDAELVVTLDADGQHDPADITRLLDAAKDRNSFVIGSRTGDLGEMPVARRIANRAVSYGISKLLGFRVADTQSGFRVFPVRLIKERKFSQARYGIETEMLFAARDLGLSIREVPTRTVYFEKANVQWRKDLVNFLDIFSIILFRGVPSAFRISQAWGGAGIATALAVALILQLNFALKPFERALERGAQIFSKLAPGPRVQERLAVFEWLARNTPPEAIVFATRFEGHRIMALADRRAVVSSKVYPSESADVARRVRDTARFFFATDNGEAERILREYGASYVLVNRARDWFGLCREISACQWVTVKRNLEAQSFSAGDLTPEGARRTLVGKLLGKAELPFLQKVWDSPSYLLYRVIDASEPAPCELTGEDRQAILDFVRYGGAAEEDVFRRQCGISLSIWRNGVKQYSGASEGRMLGEGIRVILSDFLGNVSEAEAIEVAVWDEDAAYPLSLSGFGSRTLELDHGYRMIVGGKSSYVFPVFPGTEIFRPSVGAKLSAFPVDAFTDVGGAIRQADSGIWTDEALRLRVRGAIDWILGLQRSDGTFRAFVDPFRPDVEEQEPRDIALDALGSWALAEGYAAFRDPRYLTAASKGVIAVERRIQSGEPIRTNTLSFALMTRLRLWEATRDVRNLRAAAHHADRLRLLISKDLWVPERFRVAIGGIQPVGNEYSRIATHIAFWALSRYSGATGLVASDDLQKFAAILENRFLVNRIVDRDLNLAETARLANGFRAFARSSGDEGYLRAAELVGTWLADFQYLDRPYALDGAFPENPETVSIDTNSVGRVAEGLVFAGAGFRESARAALGWLMRMQYDADSLYFVSPRARGSLAGGLRGNLTDYAAPIGSASHFILSGLWYLQNP